MPDKSFDLLPALADPAAGDLVAVDDVSAVPVATSQATLANLAKAFTSPSGTVAVGTTRAINTTAPLTGGGDLSADRTLALTTSPAGQTPVGVTRQVTTAAPLTGGGALSADLALAVSTMIGDAGAGGARGVVPAPGAGDAAAGKFLKADATFAVPPGTGVTAVTGTAPIASSGGTTPAISLADTAVTPGSYTSADITVDAKGRLTAASNGAGGTALVAQNDLRLSVVTADPVPAADQVGAGTLYLTPWKGNQIALADGSGVFTVRSTAEVSLALAGLTSGKNYDVWARWTGSAVALDLSAAWTTDTARADAIVRSSGVWVKSGDTTRRLVGTIRATGAATTEDSAAKRFVWNASNRVCRRGTRRDSTASWTKTGTSQQAINGGNATWKFEFVLGLNEDPVCGGIQLYSTGTPAYCTAVLLDATAFALTTPTQVPGNSQANAGWTAYATYLPGIGYHFLQGVESSGSAGTATAYGQELLGTAASFAHFTTEVWA